MLKKIIFPIIGLLFVCTINSNNYISGNEKEKICYKIKKIKSKNNIYIIYAQRNDTLFKILSSKEVSQVSSGYEKIRRGKCYRLELETLFPLELLGVKLMSPGTTGRTGINFNGNLVEIEPQKGIWDLFYAKNLKGLYIKEENQ